MLFSPEGTYTSMSGFHSISYNIVPLTDDIIVAIREGRKRANLKKELRKLVTQFDSDAYTIEQLKYIVDAFSINKPQSISEEE